MADRRYYYGPRPPPKRGYDLHRSVEAPAPRRKEYVVVRHQTRLSRASSFKDLDDEPRAMSPRAHPLRHAKSVGELRAQDRSPQGRGPGEDDYHFATLPMDVLPDSLYDSSPHVSKLHQWSQWRTNVNQSLANDLLTNSHREIPGARQRDTLEIAKGDGGGRGGIINKYGTANDHGTALEFGDYLNYGIPRASATTASPRPGGGRQSSDGDNFSSSFATDDDDSDLPASDRRRWHGAGGGGFYNGREGGPWERGPKPAAYTIYKLDELEKHGPNGPVLRKVKQSQPPRRRGDGPRAYEPRYVQKRAPIEPANPRSGRLRETGDRGYRRYPGYP